MISKYENLLAKELDEEGIKYVREFPFHPSRKWRADFYLPVYRLLIEIEGISYKGGAYRHQTGQGFQQDAVKYNEAAILGYRLLRFTPAMVSGDAISPLKGVKKEERAIHTIKRYIDEQ